MTIQKLCHYSLAVFMKLTEVLLSLSLVIILDCN